MGKCQNRYRKLFVFIVQIEEDSWFVKKGRKPLYVKGQRFPVPIISNNIQNAMDKFDREYEGSEYPRKSVVEVLVGDTFLYSPLIDTVKL